jgi:predicted transposase YdaD
LPSWSPATSVFYWLFQHQLDRILPLLPDLPADAGGYRFSAPVLKEREYRLDGLFLPPPERPDLPALILEAPMAADGGFLRVPRQSGWGVALGEARGVALGQAQGEAKGTLRQLSRRCGSLSAEQESRIRSLPLERLEALAEALLDFEGLADLIAWLAASAW